MFSQTLAHTNAHMYTDIHVYSVINKMSSEEKLTAALLLYSRIITVTLLFCLYLNGKKQGNLAQA